MTAAEEPVERSRARFLRHLLDQRPASVLDVGCGAGQLLRALAEAGVPAVGVEPSEERVAELVRAGLDARRASADELPFADGELAWVALRHVLHHLPDPAAAVREAARVAREGLVLAEPWKPGERPDLRTAERVDAWVKRQDRRLGEVHEPDLAPETMRALLPGDGWSVEVDRFDLDARRPPAEVRAALEARLAGLAEDHPDRAEHAELLALAERTGVAFPGTAILVARRTS